MRMTKSNILTPRLLSALSGVRFPCGLPTGWGWNGNVFQNAGNRVPCERQFQTIVAVDSVCVPERERRGRIEAMNGWVLEAMMYSLVRGIPVRAQPACPGASATSKSPEYG